MPFTKIGPSDIDTKHFIVWATSFHCRQRGIPFKLGLANKTEDLYWNSKGFGFPA